MLFYVSGLGKNRLGWARQMRTPSATGAGNNGEMAAPGGSNSLEPWRGQWALPGVAFLEPGESVPTLGLCPGCSLGPGLCGPQRAPAQAPALLPASQVSAASATTTTTAWSWGLGGRQREGQSRSPPGTRVLTAASCHCRRSLPPRGPSSGLPEEVPATTSRSRSRELKAVPYLEGLTSSPRGSHDEGPDFGTSSSPNGDTPDDTSSLSSVNWDTVKRQAEAPSADELTVMIPWRPQEGPRADSAQRAPSVLTKPPVGGDTAGQRKEDTSSGRQHWAKLRGESGCFSLERLHCTQQDNPRPASPHRSTQRNNPRNSSPHRTNKDIPWASFPLRPTQSDGPRTSSPSRSKQSEVPWASVALRPIQGDRPLTSSPTRPVQRDPLQSSSRPTQHNSPSRAASSSHNPGHHSASSPLYPLSHGASQTSSDPSQPPCAVCIGHRDAPRASSPPRYLQHDPFPFFPEPRASESDSVHHDPPYIPPAVCIGHRDAPRASSPPRHAQFHPFPFLPDTSDAESQSPQHDPPQFPPLVCIGYRDAPRASSPPRQAPEPSLLFQDLPRASTESLVPSTDSLYEPPHIPTPVCIGHRDAPYFSSPPRQAPEPSLFFQDPPGTSMESLAPSTDSLNGAPMLLPQVCIGHRDAPRASSPPRHPPSDLALLALSPPPGSSGGSRGSAPPGETRHSLDREEYTMLADLPPPRRLAQREPGPQAQGSNGGRTRSPGRAEVERLFGQERR
ncbi:TRIO and F-actin-binding protein-like [Trichechus inunguis]